MEKIPTLHVAPVPQTVLAQCANLNPHVAFPFSEVFASHIGTEATQRDALVFEAVISHAFIREQIHPRGRPHWSLVHQGFADDGIASVTFTSAHGTEYGKKGRYIETKFSMDFYREGFVRGILSHVPRTAVEVHGYRVRWACLRIRDHIPLSKRGVLRADVIGVCDGREEVLLASARCTYAHMHAVQ